jgi:hypothetical protein
MERNDSDLLHIKSSGDDFYLLFKCQFSKILPITFNRYDLKSIQVPWNTHHPHLKFAVCFLAAISSVGLDYSFFKKDCRFICSTFLLL